VPSPRPASRPARGRHSRRTAIRLVVGLAAAAAVLSGPVHPTYGTALSSAAATTDPAAPTPFDVPTRLRVSSFNLLGYGHTVRGGDHPKYTDGITRMKWAVRILRKNDVQVVGFQEMQKPQFQRFHELTSQGYGIYPGDQLTTAAMANSIAWQKSRWRLVEARTVQIPYFRGHLIRMPYILLENRRTGRQAWFLNTHNPSNARGPAQRWRDKAVGIEIRLLNRLQADYPTTPIISTGDENDKERYFCPMVKRSQMRASNGGGLLGTTCVRPDDMRVDWVMGGPLVEFTSSVALRSRLVQKTTDHFVIVADAVLPSAPVATTGTRHVVVLTVDGLTSRALTASGASGAAPHLQRLIDGGASTLNARTEAESTGQLANLGGILTGRPVNPAIGGTGIGWPGAPRGPVSASAGHYVSSMFDVAHNYGRSTALYASRAAVDRIASSWNATNGRADHFGLDDGRKKIGQYVRTRGDGDTVHALVSRLAARPAKLAVAQLVGLGAAGRKYGFRSAEYDKALVATDRLVGKVQAAIANNPKLDGHTMLVVTANRGGGRATADPTRVRQIYRVPLLVSGPAVLAGGDLYAMNPTYRDPGSSNPGYAGRPIRNSLVANLVTKMLRLPPVPGSRLARAQDLTVLSP
jgi:hypothetical protein